MSAKEIEVFSTILSLKPEISYFTKPHNKILKDKVKHLSDSEITRVKKKLLGLGVIEEIPHTKDKRKNITLPVFSLRAFQKYVQKEKKLTIVFPYEIEIAEEHE